MATLILRKKNAKLRNILRKAQRKFNWTENYLLTVCSQLLTRGSVDVLFLLKVPSEKSLRDNTAFKISKSGHLFQELCSGLGLRDLPHYNCFHCPSASSRTVVISPRSRERTSNPTLTLWRS
mmetsp:Transcript_4982/g.12080  ORF Transcript_4982/g.12080 Transcript_4982/m.12080 type:complete len:122 (+) Transcript_4982:735-1100(+)